MKKKEYLTPAITMMEIEVEELIAASERGSIHNYDNDDDAWEDEI